eukprot:5004761-Amphidinium_carterae.1
MSVSDHNRFVDNFEAQGAFILSIAPVTQEEQPRIVELTNWIAATAEKYRAGFKDLIATIANGNQAKGIPAYETTPVTGKAAWSQRMQPNFN